MAYDVAARAIRGRDAKCNFPPPKELTPCMETIIQQLADERKRYAHSNGFEPQSLYPVLEEFYIKDTEAVNQHDRQGRKKNGELRGRKSRKVKPVDSSNDDFDQQTFTANVSTQDHYVAGKSEQEYESVPFQQEML